MVTGAIVVNNNNLFGLANAPTQSDGLNTCFVAGRGVEQMKFPTLRFGGLVGSVVQFTHEPPLVLPSFVDL